MNKIILELFSGSKSVSETFESNGWIAFTVDNNLKLKPSICCDILDLHEWRLPFRPDFVWASPDCHTFSRANTLPNWKKETIKYRQYKYTPISEAAEKSLAFLQKTTSIISYFQTCLFIIENPIGRIHHLNPMKKLGHYRYAVNYADYGFPYSKETYLFSNFFLPFSTKKVWSNSPGLLSINSKYQRSKVPPALVQTIIDYLP